MDLLLGIDVGTTATKAMLFDRQGQVLASASAAYDLIMPHPGWVEQDPEALWRAVVQTVRAVVGHVGRCDRVVALSQSSQAGTTIPVDEQGQPLGMAISWMDERAAEQARSIEEHWGSAFIKATTGWTLWGGLPLLHIAWLRQNEPEFFAGARRFLFVNDFLAFRLTGSCCMDPSDAGITQLFSVLTGDWDDVLLQIAGITRAQLSPIAPSAHVIGHLTPDAASLLGLPESVLVVNGAHDQYCAAVGVGVALPGETMLSAGTAWVLLVVPGSLEAGLASGMNISRHPAPGRFGAVRSMGGVGASLEWLLDNVFGEVAAPLQPALDVRQRRDLLLAALNTAAGRSPAGARGLLFLPPAGGHATATGAGRRGFLGLSLSHTRDDLARAVMEGVAFELRWALEEIARAGVSITELRMIGGAARSPVWPAIISDVCRVPVKLPDVKEAACRGAAILAGVGAGLLPDLVGGFGAAGGPEQYLEPRAELRSLYDELFGSYRELFQQLNPPDTGSPA